MFDRNKEKQPDQPDHLGGASSQAASSNSSPAAFKAPAASSSGKPATLGSTINIKGDITGEENLLIEGRVDGSISLSSHELTIGRTGKVHADIVAKAIRIDGEVQGDITGHEKVAVSSTSNIKGNIITPKMTLEEGARFKGTIDIDPNHTKGSTTSSPSPSANTSSSTASHSSGSNTSNIKSAAAPAKPA